MEIGAETHILRMCAIGDGEGSHKIVLHPLFQYLFKVSIVQRGQIIVNGSGS